MLTVKNELNDGINEVITKVVGDEEHVSVITELKAILVNEENYNSMAKMLNSFNSTSQKGDFSIALDGMIGYVTVYYKGISCVTIEEVNKATEEAVKAFNEHINDILDCVEWNEMMKNR